MLVVGAILFVGLIPFFGYRELARPSARTSFTLLFSSAEPRLAHVLLESMQDHVERSLCTLL